MHVSKQILSFLKNLDLKTELPDEVKVMNPFKEEYTYYICRQFYNKYYGDNNHRHLILGINPGRFGGGITGIPFTDPLRLASVCGIENKFQKKQELSSLFIYDVIASFGSAASFYSKFYISSICPLGFTKHNKNLNYYDDKVLEKSIKNFVIQSMNKQLQFCGRQDVAFCLGEGKNFAYFTKLNKEMKFFKKIVPLAHPRFIMQYKLKKKDEYIERYLCELSVVDNE